MIAGPAKGLLLGLALLAGMRVANAAIESHSKDVVVDLPTDLPELAQTRGQAMDLHNTNDGRTFLYIEQRDGQRLAILDVTDPGNIKQPASVRINSPAAFDFVRPLGDDVELIRFRNGAGVAVLNLHKPQAPKLRTLSGLREAGHTEPIGETSFLMVNEPYDFVNRIARDYQVVDTSIPSKPTLLTTVSQVTQKLKEDDTGTAFLLGKDGLTVIRRPRVEAEHNEELTEESHN